LSRYPARVAESLLPLSIAATLPEAIEEWYFTENIEDHYEPIETCQLCGQEDLRYHFEIENEFTHKTLWVGSHCILQFDVPVYDGERRLTPKETKAKLDKLTEKMQLDSCVKALEKLAQTENTDILRNALAYYQRRKKLSPKFAFVVFWRLSKHKIDHRPSFFSIDLKRNKYADDLREMETSRVHFFWKALTIPQRQRAIEMGHYPPPAASK
jgi:hypothetical protein